MARIESIVASLSGIPISAAISIKDDYAKIPQTGLWDLMKANADQSPQFFVGSCAGRLQDSSAADRKFALNLRVPFYTVEEFFLQQRPQTYHLGFTPFAWNLSADSSPLSAHIPEDLKDSECSLVLLVGLPSSGKT